MKHHSQDFLFLKAVGDSYAMQYEFVEHAQDKTAADLVHGRHPKFHEFVPGNYSDDTQMSIANMELLLRNVSVTRDTKISDDDFIARWLGAFHRDPHIGYSEYFYKVMESSETCDDFRSKIDPKVSVAGGAAMRAAPFGLLADIDLVKTLTTQQARITHDNTVGVHSALAVALSVHYLHHGGLRRDLPDFIERHLGQGWNAADKGYTEHIGNGLKIVTQALNAVYKAESLSGVLLNVVNQDSLSDTDTVAAIAMAVASRSRDLADDLPVSLKAAVENGSFGADYLRQLDAVALKHFPPTTTYEQPGYSMQRRVFPRKDIGR